MCRCTQIRFWDQESWAPQASLPHTIQLQLPFSKISASARAPQLTTARCAAPRVMHHKSDSCINGVRNSADPCQTVELPGASADPSLSSSSHCSWLQADLNTSLENEAGSFYGVSSQYESSEDMIITCSTKVCSFGKQVVEKVEVRKTGFPSFLPLKVVPFPSL